MQPALLIHMDEGLTNGFDDLFEPRLGFRKIAPDLGLQAGRPEVVHDEEPVVPGHLNPVKPHERRVFQ